MYDAALKAMLGTLCMSLHPCAMPYNAHSAVMQQYKHFAVLGIQGEFLSFGVAIAKQSQAYLMMLQKLLRLLLPAPHLQGTFVGEHLCLSWEPAQKQLHCMTLVS